MERYESETSSGSTALAHRARVAFPERVRVSTKAALLPGRYPLPPEVSESAVWRLAAIALAFSVSSVAVWFVGQRLDIGSIDPDHAPPSYSTSLILGALLGLVMAAGAAWSIRSGKPPSLTLRFGLAFRFSAAF
jgi:asparagine N-glycosylation enzyme membrane subunit Stt3